jgi:hypothetical protein
MDHFPRQMVLGCNSANAGRGRPARIAGNLGSLHLGSVRECDTREFWVLGHTLTRPYISPSRVGTNRRVNPGTQFMRARHPENVTCSTGRSSYRVVSCSRYPLFWASRTHDMSAVVGINHNLIGASPPTGGEVPFKRLSPNHTRRGRRPRSSSLTVLAGCYWPMISGIGTVVVPKRGLKCKQWLTAPITLT